MTDIQNTYMGREEGRGADNACLLSTRYCCLRRNAVAGLKNTDNSVCRLIYMYVLFISPTPLQFHTASKKAENKNKK